MPQTPRILVKLRPQTSLAAASSSSNLRPLFDAAPATMLGLSEAPQWFMADLPDAGPSPWDGAHSQVSRAIGLDEGAVLYAEPDLPQSYPSEKEANPGGNPFALGGQGCTPNGQNNDSRPVGPGFAWHLRDEFTQLATARASVEFKAPRTRIAHIDTGYDPNHTARPARILAELQHTFVDDDGNPNSAADPFRGHLLDQSGHGTGTIGILAGQGVAQNSGQPIGGAPDADIVPLRIANSVVLFWTSAFARAIQYAVANGCDVVSISMGGLPSAAWNDAVNAAYEAGVCIVAASGDCFGGLPTHHVVYPARYQRTIAACGVMANGAPYYDLPIKIIEGSWGPDRAMRAALAAYAPNTPWARFGCSDVVDMDGAGTSSATPQIAAAVALWFEKYKAQLPRNWQRIEAVRNALFQLPVEHLDSKLGRGTLKANHALDVAPRLNLPKTAPDSDSFAFFRVLTGLGLDEPTARERMLNLELSQRYLRNPALAEAVPDPDASVGKDSLKKFMDAVIGDKEASQTLRRAVAERYQAIVGTAVPGVQLDDVMPQHAALETVPVPAPPCRRLRTYAMDPSFSTRLSTASLNQGLVQVPWEDLKPGPEGEYILVDDADADFVTVHPPVDLNDPKLIAQDGFAPSEGNPQFHQQMVYAVAMNTITRFEQALGRKVLWRARVPEGSFDDSEYVQRLIIRPHGVRQKNAYYDPDEICLKFGYFRAADNDPGDHIPGSAVYTCLSQDVITHETTHAILDGIHRRFNVPTNDDVLAFHEALADITALMQHFTMKELLENQIAQSRGNLEAETLLGSLAVQFGKAAGRTGALRDAIGTLDSNGVWQRLKPDPAAYRITKAPHTRGALLVAAVFDAFLAIYKSRTADLYRIYTGGTGILQPGAIHPDMVGRLCHEATTSASHVFLMCVRALDYVPPVDITFGEFLRGIITADFDLYPDDRYGYRVAFVEAFRWRGIFPPDLDTVSVDTLRWRGVDIQDPTGRFKPIVAYLKKFADDCLYIDDRKKLFDRTRAGRRRLHAIVKDASLADENVAKALGIDPALPIEVHELRRAERRGPDGRPIPQAVVAIAQRRPMDVPGTPQPMEFLGGATLVIDLKAPALQYAIRKRIDQKTREVQTQAFVQKMLANPLTAMLLDTGRTDRFATLHAMADLVG